jgi:hypothetical protein
MTRAWEKARRLWCERLAAPSAWLAVTIAAVVNLTGMLLELRIGSTIPGMPKAPALSSAVIGAGILLVLIGRRRRPSTELASVLFALNMVSVHATLLLTNAVYAELAERWVPFQATKLSYMVTPMLAPSFALAIASIGLSVAATIFQLGTFSAEVRARIGPIEPWATAAFAVAGLLVAVFRFLRIATERRLLAAEAEAAASRRLTDAILGVRDLMNTPLQTLELGAAALQPAAGMHDGLVKAMRGSVAKLRGLNELLSRYEHEADWRTLPASFDARSRVEEGVAWSPEGGGGP